MSDVTRILGQIEDGDPSAAEKLLPLVYTELRRLAAARMANEAPDHTLQGTALVHEAYVRLVDDGETRTWDSRGHFFAAAAEAMRRILVDHARRKQTLRHGGHFQRAALSDDLRASAAEPSFDLLALNESIGRLEQDHSDAAKVVKLRYFCGMTIAEAAQALGSSHATVERLWTYARARLHSELFTE